MRRERAKKAPTSRISEASQNVREKRGIPTRAWLATAYVAVSRHSAARGSGTDNIEGEGRISGATTMT
jgi:hypothetical protein